MPYYVVRFSANSCVRLNAKSYLDRKNNDTIRMVLPRATIVLFDQSISIDNTLLPNGLIIQVALDAQDIETAIQSAGSFAVGALNIMSSVACASINRPIILSAYDASNEVQDRDFIGFTYDRTIPVSTRWLAIPELENFITMSDQFHSDAEITQDHKNRVSRAFDAYRRALADNEDPLTDFIVLWSAFESLDCVYRKTFPTRQPKFKDGMKDVFKRLKKPGSFKPLNELRDDIAHGNLELNAANQMAMENLELVRKALLLAVMRIIKCENTVQESILTNTAYKGLFVTHLRLQAKVRCQPGDINSLVLKQAIPVC